jgi:succinyl-CoA synthetase beta subunit
MNIHEYQGKEVLKQYGVVVPEGKVAFTVDEAVAAAEALGTKICVVR